MGRCSQSQVRNERRDCNVRRPRSLARSFRTRNLPNPQWKSLETSEVGSGVTSRQMAISMMGQENYMTISTSTDL